MGSDKPGFVHHPPSKEANREEMMASTETRSRKAKKESALRQERHVRKTPDKILFFGNENRDTVTPRQFMNHIKELALIERRPIVSEEKETDTPKPEFTEADRTMIGFYLHLKGTAYSWYHTIVELPKFKGKNWDQIRQFFLETFDNKTDTIDTPHPPHTDWKPPDEILFHGEEEKDILTTHQFIYHIEKLALIQRQTDKEEQLPISIRPPFYPPIHPPIPEGNPSNYNILF